MKKYRVVFHPDAETDIESSYQWGRRVWGDKQAKTWVCELRRTIKSRLKTRPLSCPLAPESEDLGIEIRQLIMQRYRVLFILKKRTATILHVRGPYVPKLQVDEAAKDQS